MQEPEGWTLYFQAHLAGWHFPYLTYHLGHAQVRPAGVGGGGGDWCWVWVLETKEEWSLESYPHYDHHLDRSLVTPVQEHQAKIDQCGQYLKRRKIQYGSWGGEGNHCFREDLHCYWQIHRWVWHCLSSWLTGPLADISGSRVGRRDGRPVWLTRPELMEVYWDWTSDPVIMVNDHILCPLWIQTLPRINFFIGEVK